MELVGRFSTQWLDQAKNHSRSNTVKTVYFIVGLLSWGLTAQAQQTIFNVPSSDIIPKNRVMAQEQVDINRDQLRSSTTFDYGLGHNWEVGLNLYNLDYLPPERTWLRNDTTTQMPYAPLLLVNAQRVFDLTENLHIGVGGQTGANLFPSQKSTWVGWAYTNLGCDFAEDHYKAVVGGYAGNKPYLGEGSTVGLHMGFDAGIWYQKLHLLGDWATGTHDYGQLTVGVEVYLAKHIPVAVGWRRSNLDGNQAVVVQLTYTPD